MKTPQQPMAAEPAPKEARQIAAAVLEVLAGARTPQAAAAALGWSVPRYYQVEARALRGLVAACAPAPRGRPRPAAAELEALRRAQARLERELRRQQALVRLTQRHVGLPPPAAAKPAGKKPRWRKTVRALTVADRWRAEAPADPPAAPPT